MKYSLLYLFFFVSLSSLLAQTGTGASAKMDFENYDPPATLKVPGKVITKARFPFIDVHSHQRNLGEKDLSKLANEMDAMNMGIMVNLSGGSGSSITSAISNISKTYPGRFVVFANVNFSGVGNSDWAKKAADQLRVDVKNGANGLKIYKSLGLYNSDTDGKRIAIDDPRLDPIWQVCGELGIPVLIHAADPAPFWEDHDENNERWLELKLRPRRKRGDNDPAPWQQIIDEQHRMFKNHPNTKFINAHMGWYANDLQKLSSLLEEMPNMYVEIGAVIAELGRQPRNAREFMDKYQNRILFGKDAYNPEEYHTYFRVLESNDEYFPYYKRYHAFWKMYGLGLSDNILKKLYYKNALNIIPNLDASIFPK